MWKIPVLGMALIATLAVPACSSSDSKPTPGAREFGLTDAQFADHVERTQDLIATCMKRAGFDYVPVDVATIEKAQASIRKEPGLSRRDYALKYGLSVTTRFDDPVFTIGLGPNADTMNALPPAQKTAYQMTLLGPNKDANFAFAFDEEDFSDTGGCTREAVSQVFTPDQLTGTYVNPKDELLDNDPRMRDARNKWSSCMQDQGLPYKDDDGSIIDDFKKRLEALTGGDDPAELTGDRLDKLHAMQADEIKAAVASEDCRAKFVDATEQTVETELFGHPVSD